VVVWVVVSALATTVSGCGSSATSSTEPDTDWRGPVVALCERLVDAEPTERVPRTLAQARELASQVEAYTAELDEGVRRLRDAQAVPVPGPIVRAVAELASAGRELRRSTLEGDPDAAEDAVGRLERTGARLDELAERWDLEACGGY
jgi:hypothetical protein